MTAEGTRNDSHEQDHRHCPVCDNAPMELHHLEKSRPDVWYDSYTWVCTGCGAVRSRAPWRFRGMRRCAGCETIGPPKPGIINEVLRCRNCNEYLGNAIGP